MIARALTGLVIALVVVSAAFAQTEGNPENWCRGGTFPSDSDDFSIGTAKGQKGSRIYFFNDFESDCPVAKGCKGSSYIIPGNKVVVARSYKGFACSWYTSPKGNATTGWIRLADLDIRKAAASPKIGSWLGEWAYADNDIKFTENKLPGTLNVTGNAFWKGLGDNVHIGELDGRAEPKGTLLKLGEEDTDEFACKVTMRLVDSFLVVRDNMNCGGANVSFSGVYLKKR